MSAPSLESTAASFSQAVLRELAENLRLWGKHYSTKPIALSLFRAAAIIDQFAAMGGTVGEAGITPPPSYGGIENVALGASWLMEAFEDMVRQHCHTARVDRDYNGQVAGSMVTDSGGLSSDAEALRFLAGLGKFRIVAEHGRMVVGYWPENDPEKKNAQGLA